MSYPVCVPGAMQLPPTEALDTALYFMEEPEASPNQNRAQGVHMLSALLERLVTTTEESQVALLVGALRPRLVAVLNAVSSELNSDSAIMTAAGAVRAARMAGVLLVHQALMSPPQVQTQRAHLLTPGSGQGEHLAARRDGLRSQDGGPPGSAGQHSPAAPPSTPDGRAHAIAARKTLRAVADMCLRLPNGSEGWSAALWVVTHPKLSVDLLVRQGSHSGPIL